MANFTIGQYKEKGSKFIGLAVNCEDEEQATALIENWRNEHHQASHLCYAYRFGVQEYRYRANDDGEPSNSAGMPILGQIQSFDLTNVLIGVVRYYGGTKLGVGGLINAYRTAAKEAIEKGKVIEKSLHDYFALYFEYSDMAFLMDEVKNNTVEIKEQCFEDTCYLKISCTPDQTEEIVRKLAAYKSLKIKKIGTF